MNKSIRTSRRAFLAGTAGLVIGTYLAPRGLRAQEAAAGGGGNPLPQPNAFVRIAPDDTVTVIVKHIEFGQGPNTGLATLVAEELDADWSQMRAESAPANDETYKNFAFGSQGTGGSTAMANSYMQMRQVGAMARAMLVAAAAAEWGVPAEEITVEKGKISHPSGQSSSFGAFAEAAAQQQPPAEPVLKDPANFTLIGTDLPKLDTQKKTNGSAIFGMDQYPDGVQTVVLARPPKFGATPGSVDDAAALAVPGVNAVHTLPQGVAVYADSTFAALRGRDALSIEWDESGAETRSSAAMEQEWAAAAKAGGAVVEEEGDLSGLEAEGVEVMEAEFMFPFLAHAPMEPLNGIIEVSGGEARASYGAQFPGGDQMTIAQVLGIDPTAVTVEVTLAGGSFGRRAQQDAHFAAELASVAKAAGDGAYKLVWTREDDIRGGYYRPMTAHYLRAGLDGDGNITGWQNDLANQSIMIGSPMGEMMGAKEIDPTSFEGSNMLPYDFGGRRVSWTKMDAGVPVLWWRSVGSSHTATAVEVFLDELLEAGGKDAVQGRLDLLKEDATRERAVIEKVAEIANWQGRSANGKGYGMAYAKSFGTYVAQIAEVEDRGGVPHVTKVWCAVDCGVAVNPNVIRAQMEGGIGYGLGAALFDEIVIAEGGEVVQSNFDDYRMLRIAEMPAVEVAIIDSTADPTGVGEPGVPPIAPAVINGWRGLTGQKIRRLPIVQPMV
ncbi:molybdopterin-dependent oxidoreductase [Paracoccus sp. TK19116]|uniref:Molybdopterin-dependent oxidoreductase n=1 Tax=Paracoccus albicereus TaxID=2922394 RepID=A0ABT1MU97_9RHOB|nr:molybdopterin cofactor-binding domain-containing protein [Paracoccus albicereus]MCQ0971907.1 molybdopterin-dependent oxidoreductase [Paracoccus albicereus]